MGSSRRIFNHLVAPIRWTIVKQSSRNQVERVLSRLHAVDGGHELVRIGGGKDGGYLLPDDLEGVRACFSPGVGGSSDFELDLEHRGIPSFLADASVAGPGPGAAHMDFERKFVGACSIGDTISLDDWVATKSLALPAGDLLMQMDIEGAEYECLLAASRSTLRRFRIIALELHGLDLLEQPFANRMIGATLEKLAVDFLPVHLHPNNIDPIASVSRIKVPPTLEVTYLRRDRVRSMAPRRVYPHPADRDCVLGRPTVALPDSLIG